MIAFHFDHDLGARVATVSQRVHDDELLDSYQSLLSSPDYDPDLNDLVDMRGVERFEVSGDAIRQLVRSFARFSGADNRLAIVAGSDVVYGMARMYEQLRSDTTEEIRVFRDVDEARAWLKQSRRRRVS